jgi:hypothetical protein
MILSVSSSVKETNGVPSCGCLHIRNIFLRFLENNRSHGSQDDIVDVARRKQISDPTSDTGFLEPYEAARILKPVNI